MKKAKIFFGSFLGLLFFLGWAWIYLLPLPGDIPVFMYHFVGGEDQAANSGNILTRESFKRQMDYLEFFGYRVLSMEEYADIMQGRRKPKGREIVITFDDGNESYAEVFQSLLRTYQFPSTIFLVSESVKGRLHGSMPEAAVHEVLQDPLVTIGSHTKTHPFLSEISAEAKEDEILNSKKDLESMFGRPVRFFSYPFGDFNAEVLEMAQRAGYDLAFTTSAKKLKGIREGPFSRTRTKMMQQADNPFVFLTMSSGIYQNVKRWRAQVAFKKSPINQP